MIRLLDEHDREACIKIARLKDRNSGTTKSSDDVLDSLLQFDRNRIIGWFEEDKLITWIAARFGTLHGEKAWSIISMYTAKFNDHFTFNRPDFGLIMKDMFEFAEANQYYTYVYTISTRLEAVYDRKWSSNKFLPPSNRYTREKIVEVPANEEAPEQWQQRLIGGVKPDAISILKRTLKMEYRK